MGAQTPQMILLPWDPDSAEHVERLYQQRTACGWNKERVQGWRDLQSAGKMALQWVVLPTSDPSTISKLSLHTSSCPTESLPISDSATSFGGKPRVPNGSHTFIPIGHISLDSVNPDPDAADPSRGIYRIASLYISTALQSAGLGRAVMDEVERMAMSEPLNAKTLTLGAVANEYEGKKERLEAFGREEPTVSLQDWYARRGYVVYKIHPNLWSETDKNGNVHWVTHVSMKKDIK